MHYPDILKFAKKIDRFANKIRKFDCEYNGWEVFSFYQTMNGKEVDRMQGEPFFILKKGGTLKFVTGAEGFKVLRVVLRNIPNET